MFVPQDKGISFGIKHVRHALYPNLGISTLFSAPFRLFQMNLVSKYKSRPFNILGLEIDYHTQQAVSQESAKGPMFIEGFFH